MQLAVLDNFNVVPFIDLLLSLFGTTLCLSLLLLSRELGMLENLLGGHVHVFGLQADPVLLLHNHDGLADLVEDVAYRLLIHLVQCAFDEADFVLLQPVHVNPNKHP